VNYFEQARGLEPDASPVAAEHLEPWPGGRVNHYLFDLNRDWIALTQPEVLNQVKVLREWFRWSMWTCTKWAPTAPISSAPNPTPTIPI
jgi:hypothetical protein